MAKKKENNRCYLYRRTSSTKQDPYLSPERQSWLEESYIRREGLEVVEVFTDIGSGLDTESRLNFLRMIEKAMDPSNDVAHIVVSDLSRFTREKTPQVWIDALLDEGLVIHSTEEGKSTDDYTEDYWDTQFLSNNRFSRRVSKDTIEGQNSSVRMGNFVSSVVPYGYKKYKRTIKGRKRPKLKRDPKTAHIVVMIFEMRADGTRTMVIVKHLNDMGIPGPRGGLWTANTVRAILKSKVYLGYSIIGKTSRSKFPRHRRAREYIEIPNAHKPLVSEELFRKANEQIEDSTRSGSYSPRSEVSPNLLSPRIKCGLCTATMQVINRGKTKGLICATKKGSGSSQCNKKDVPLSNIMDQLTIELSLRILTEDSVNEQIQRVQQEFGDELSIEKKRQAKITTRISKIEEERGRLTKAIAKFDEEYPGAVADLMKEISDLRREKEDLEKEKIEIQEETKERMVFLTDPDNILQTALDLQTYLSTDDEDAKRQLLRYFIKQVDLHDEYGTIHYNLPVPGADPTDGQYTSKIALKNAFVLSEHSKPSP